MSVVRSMASRYTDFNEATMNDWELLEACFMAHFSNPSHFSLAETQPEWFICEKERILCSHGRSEGQNIIRLYRIQSVYSMLQLVDRRLTQMLIG